MSPHVDILDQPERLAPSFFGSIAFHGLLVAAVAGVGWVQSRNTISLGDPNGGRSEPWPSTPVASIALPSHAGPKNPVANDTESAGAGSGVQGQAGAQSDSCPIPRRFRSRAATPN